MKPLSYKRILKEAPEELKIAVKKYKKLKKEAEELEGTFTAMLRCGNEDCIEYWEGRIDVLITILGYNQKELNKLLK